MFVGTGSDVGKSVINAAFCRIFKQDGYSPAPFKAQNMSLNSYATSDGLEIGRAQAVQAEACGIPCRVEMNPVLLKPTSYQTSQVVLNGKPIGNKSAKEFFLETDRNRLFAEAMKAFDTLHNEYSPVVVEGAGSISEMNLWDKDITNMRVATHANIPTFLIADIDKGGVFASLYGSIKLLPQEERDCIKGIIINKFRGDIDLFQEGKEILEKITGKPVVGIIPYFRDIFIEQEDSVVLDQKNNTATKNKINVAVVLLPHMSNFTDFDVLSKIPEVNLYYSAKTSEIDKADMVIIPGSKNTIADLQFLNTTRLSKTIQRKAKAGKQVYGICGGYQMLGMKIKDPLGVEGDTKEIEGLGILPVETELTKEKKTEQCTFRFLDSKEECTGYEIHMGISAAKHSRPLCNIGKASDGYFLNDRVWGTYIHGIFDNIPVVQHALQQIQPKIKIDFNYKTFKDAEFDRLANLVRKNVDMNYIYRQLKA
jgi:adenosylcobyric acid synthase